MSVSSVIARADGPVAPGNPVAPTTTSAQRHKEERKIALACLRANKLEGQPQLQASDTNKVHACIKAYQESVSSCAKVRYQILNVQNMSPTDVPHYRICEDEAFAAIK